MTDKTAEQTAVRRKMLANGYTPLAGLVSDLNQGYGRRGSRVKDNLSTRKRVGPR